MALNFPCQSKTRAIWCAWMCRKLSAVRKRRNFEVLLTSACLTVVEARYSGVYGGARPNILNFSAATAIAKRRYT